MRTRLNSRLNSRSCEKFPLAALPEPPVLLRILHTVEEFMEAKMGRGILLWLLGVPIPVIILLWLFFGR
jgi:hypothetical protein